MNNTSIEWANHTHNIVWGCFKVSDGCRSCYAETLSNRYGHQIWGPPETTQRRTMSATYWRQPIIWNNKAKKAGQRARVFCSSMADTFEDHLTVEGERNKLWYLIKETPWLDWLLLTKRPQNVMQMVPYTSHHWPHNVWIGTSVENQHWADIRIPELLKIPAKVRFLSCEPLLGPLDLSYWLPIYKPEEAQTPEQRAAIPWSRSSCYPIEQLSWCITGAESGPKARPMNEDWVRDIRDQCVAAGVPMFYKQSATNGKKNSLPLLDGRQWVEFPRQAVIA